jgi:hypothetical protein
MVDMSNDTRNNQEVLDRTSQTSRWDRFRGWKVVIAGAITGLVLIGVAGLAIFMAPL